MQNDGNKKGVLVVGAGLTGLQTALELAESGHLVYLVEQAPHIGGKMAQSREGAHSSLLTERIEGVRRHPNIRIVIHASVERVKGEAGNFEGFLDCIVFLRRVNLGDKSKPGKKVVVIGGGHSAIDSARTALRLGSDEVTIVYRCSRKEMPANPWEVEEAIHEDHGLSIPRWSSFEVNTATMETNRPGIYSGGDAVTGPSTVISAIAAGHVAAGSIDRYLRTI